MFRLCWLVVASALIVFVSPSSAQNVLLSFQDCDDCPELVALPGGTFIMGSPIEDIGRHESEPLPHEVSVAAFAITTTEISVGAFARFAQATDYQTGGPCWTFTDDVGWSWRQDAHWQDPLFRQTADHPVACVSWNDAVAYAAWLSEETGENYRLPTESEWEYAARAGTTGPRYWQGPREAVCAHANINDISGKNRIWKVAEPCDDGWLYAAAVGFFAPNPFGLHDMQGNVWEWVQDCYDDDASNTCTTHILRGGAWTETPGAIRITIREWRDPDEHYAWAGFRLVRE